MNKYEEALNTLAPCKEDGYECIACKDIDTCKERQAYKTLQELIDKWKKLKKVCEKNNYYMDFEYDFLRELLDE